MNQNNTWSIIIAIILTAIVVGGGVYIWQNNQQTDKAVETEDIVSQESEVIEEDSSEDELKYENDYFGFSLTFPETWEGYLVKNEADAIFFGFPTQEDIFAISILTSEEWEDLPENLPKPTQLGENDGLIFASSASQDYADKFTLERRKEVDSILDTFEVY